MSKLIRNTALFSLAALLAACGGDAETTTPTTTTDGTATAASCDATLAAADPGDYLREDDYFLGDADAPVTVMEYASVSCPACAAWHGQILPEFREKYIETGKVRFVFRPFPTAPAQMADTGHLLAYCGKREDYYTNIKVQFDRQRQLLDMLQSGKGREAYVGLAKASGLTEEEFIGCLQDEDLGKRYQDVIQEGVDLGVQGTPSFFVNGRKLNGAGTMENLSCVIDPLLPAGG